MRETRGFNLMELVVVMAIMALLVSMALPNLLNAMDRSRQSKTIADLRALANAMERYAVEESRYPSVDDLVELKKLFQPELMKKVPTRDGWKHPLDILVAPSGASFTLRSPGKDGTYQAAAAQPGEVSKTVPDDFAVDLVLIDGVFVQGPPSLLEAEG